MDHIEANTQVTLNSLKINRTTEIIKGVKERLTEVFQMSSEYLNHDSKILDIGTKDCLFFDVLIEKGFKKENLTGIDCCKEVVDTCKERGYFVLEEDAQETTLLDNSFDFIFMVHTLEHLPNPKKMINECTRLLNGNGFVLIEVPIQTEIDAPEKWGHYHPFTSKQQVKDLCGDEYRILKEDSQKTKSKSPWYRILLQKI